MPTFTAENIKGIKILETVSPWEDDNDPQLPLWEAVVVVTLTDGTTHKLFLDWVRAGTLQDLRDPDGEFADREELAYHFNNAKRLRKNQRKT